MNINLKDLLKDKAALVLAGLGALMLALVAAIALCLSGVSQQSLLLEQQENLLHASQNRVLYLQQLAGNAEENNRLAEAYRSKLPEAVSQQELFLLLQQLSEDYGVDVTAVVFGDPATRGSIKFQPLSLQLGGDYAQVVQLLNSLCYDGRLIQLDSLALTAKEDAGAVQADLAVSVYYQ